MSINVNLYPILHENARIIKMSDCCAVIDKIYGSYVLIEPFSAVVIAMCNGAVSVEKIIKIAEAILPEGYENIDQLVTSTLEKCKEYLYWKEIPLNLKWKYNPSDFLYIGVKRDNSILMPLEKPLQMTIVLTNECNFECIYCFRSARNKWDNELSKEELFDLIDQAAELEVKYCSLTGGEPTLHPHFEEVVIKLLESDIYPYISTNGTCINKETLLRLKQAGLQTIQFSIDSGNEQIFDKMVGVKGYFNTVLSNIKAAKKSGYIVRVKGVISNINADSIEQLLALCAEIKVDYVFMEPFSPGLDGRGNERLLLSQEKALMVEEVMNLAQEKYADSTIIMPFKVPEKWSCSEDIIYCGGMYTSFIAQSDGTIGACEQANHPELIFGNIKEKRLKEIWSSEEVVKFLNPVKTEIKEPCRSCESYENCRTGCFNFSLQYTNDLFAPDPRCWKVDLKNNDPLGLTQSVKTLPG